MTVAARKIQTTYQANYCMTYATKRNATRQAYRQKPWRTELKRISQILLIGFFFALTSALYLALASQMAAATQRYRSLEYSKIVLQERIISLESELAKKQGARSLKDNMSRIGFEPYSSKDLVFVGVQGYQSKQPFQLAPLYHDQQLTQPMLRTSYTESMWDLLVYTLQQYAITPGIRP